MNAAGMQDHGAFEHGAIHARGIEAEIGKVVRRFDIEQGGQVADARLEIDEGAAASLARQHARQVDRQSAGAGAAGGAEHGHHSAGGLPHRVFLDLQTLKHGLQLRFQIRLVEIMIGAFVQRAQNQLGIGSQADRENGAGHLRADFPQYIQSAIGEGRQNDHEHAHLAASQGFLGLLEGNQTRRQAIQAGL